MRLPRPNNHQETSRARVPTQAQRVFLLAVRDGKSVHVRREVETACLVNGWISMEQTAIPDCPVPAHLPALTDAGRKILE